MAVQDDRRELEMCELIGLTPGETRAGVDAFFYFVEGGLRYSVPIELKSTTSRAVSTGRDIGPTHIQKWRLKIWIFGFYDKEGVILKSLLVLGPRDMEPWIRRLEVYITPDLMIGEHLSQRLVLEDLHIICGEKDLYDLEDAKALHKQQWTKKEYRAAMDAPEGYSPQKMLEILRLRARYLNARGATLNNPHISKKFFSNFQDREVRVGADLSSLRDSIQAVTRAITLNERQLRQIARC